MVKEKIHRDLIRSWAANILNANDASHDITHADNVFVLSKKILDSFVSKPESLIYDLCYAVSLMHDIFDSKYITKYETGGDCDDGVHNVLYKERMQNMRDILTEAGMTENEVEVVASVAPVISFSKRWKRGVPLLSSEIELRVYHVVSDADMLEALGVVGVMRTFMYQSSKGGNTSEAYEYCAGPLQNRIQVLHHFWAKEEGKVRKGLMQSFLAEYARERDIA
jgi:hypothetical protein